MTIKLIEDFEDDIFILENLQLNGWYRDATKFKDGLAGLASKVITHSQTTSMTFNRTTTEAEWMEIWYTISSEVGYDKFSILVNGVLDIGNISGIFPWLQRSIQLNAGVNVITLTYMKDGGGSTGTDNVVIDNIAFHDTVPPLPPFHTIYATDRVTDTQSRQKATYEIIGWYFKGTYWAIEEDTGHPYHMKNPYTTFVGLAQGVKKPQSDFIMKQTYVTATWVFSDTSWKIGDGSTYPYLANNEPPVPPATGGVVSKGLLRANNHLSILIRIGI